MKIVLIIIILIIIIFKKNTNYNIPKNNLYNSNNILETKIQNNIKTIKNVSNNNKTDNSLSNNNNNAPNNASKNNNEQNNIVNIFPIKKRIYRKSKEKSYFENAIKYLEIYDEDNKLYIYSLNVYHNETKKACYRCMDTHCKAIVNVIFNSENNKLSFYEFSIKRNHNFKYEEHNYIRQKFIKHDIENLTYSQIKEKLKDYKYRFLYLKEIALSNFNIGINSKKLKEFFVNQFGDLNYNYSLISIEEKNKIISNYKKKKNIDANKNIIINEIINI